MLGAVVVLVAYGLWSIAGITQHDVPGNPDYFVYRQIVFVAVGALGLVRRDPDRPRRLPPLPEAPLPRDAAPVRVRVPGRHGRPRLEALDRPRLLPVPAVRVREAARRPRPRRLPRRPVPARRRGARRADDDRARAAADAARVHPAGHRLGARVRRRALRRALRRRDPLAAPRRSSALVTTVLAAGRALVAARRRHAGAEELPEGPPDRLPPSRPGSERLDLQRHAVDHRGRLGRRDRPRRRGRDPDEPQLPARARDRLRVRVARRAARLPRRRRSC